MRIAIIGLGAIAQKAYPPVVAALDDLELVLCTRDRSRLAQLSRMYRVTETAADVNEVLAKAVDAACVHTATEAHVEIAEKLLRNGIPVYVDKPIAYSYEESRRLVEVAEHSGQILMVGFNRRFAPMYANFKTQTDRQFVMMQKNRTFSPDYARRFVFDDFIHVVDTLRFLVPGAITDIRVSSVIRDGKLDQVALHLDGEGFTLIGLMNRDSGMAEETLDVIGTGNKWVVHDLNTTVQYTNGEERRQRFNDWDSVLYRRGFPQIIDHFLQCVKHNHAPSPSAREALVTHAVCEQIVAEAERNGAAPWHPSMS